MSMCCRHFDQQRPFPAGCPNLRLGRDLAWKNTHDLTGCHAGDNGNPGFFNRWSTSLLAIDKCQNSRHDSICCPYGINGSKRRTAGSNDVLDHRDAIATSEGTLEEAT